MSSELSAYQICIIMYIIAYYRQLKLLECVLEKLDNVTSCVVPEQLTDCDLCCCIATKDVMFLVEKFQCSLTAMSNDLSRLDENYKTLRLLLQLINAILLQNDNLKILQRIPQLLENTLGTYLHLSKCLYMLSVYVCVCVVCVMPCVYTCIHIV